MPLYELCGPAQGAARRDWEQTSVLPALIYNGRRALSPGKDVKRLPSEISARAKRKTRPLTILLVNMGTRSSPSLLT